MTSLVLPEFVFSEIVATVCRTREGFETGVKLFGTVVAYDSPSTARDFVALAIAGPGRNATHQPAHYAGDPEYATGIFAALGCAMPGIGWLGELHVHPRGMTWLSQGDRQTVADILTGTDDTVHPTEFVAGVMQRQDGRITIYPYHFDCNCLKGQLIPVRLVDGAAPVIYEARLEAIEKGNLDGRSRICPKPEGSPTAPAETRSYRRLRQWWERFGRYGRTLRHRQTDAR